MPIYSDKNLMSSPLRLVGLYLRPMDKTISKNLKMGWYPFGQYEEPVAGYVEVPPLSNVESSIYRTNNRIPRIMVNCIVGKNGAGKSSLLDILYRVVNNLAYRLSQFEPNVFSENLHYAYGVNADLYFHCDRRLHRISCEDDVISFYRESFQGYMEIVKLSSKSFNDILKNMFYSIAINYSIYAFNEDDYEQEYITKQKKDDLGRSWLTGLFHKNAGYSTPITIVPYREHGVIDVKRENELAHQRILTFSLLSLAKRKEFPYGYKPRAVSFKIRKDYRIKKWKQFTQKHQEINADLLENIRVELEDVWEDYVSSDLSSLFSSKSEMYRLVLFYLSYKSLKICLTYSDYKHFFDKDLTTSKEVAYENALGANLPKNAERIVHELMNHPIDHVTIKIHQCLNYIRRGDSRLFGKINASAYVKEHHVGTYDETFVQLMLPSFFDMDIEYVRKDKVLVNDGSMTYYPGAENAFSLNKMSSGEKQMMYMLSYVIYHLKNIQGVNTDNYRVPYHHVCLVFDEAELYYHPEYQRKFISMLLESLASANIDRRKIRSVNILVATHSPFILSDVLTQNTLYLEDGIPKQVKKQTFGGNYYDMLRSSFFFTSSAIGDISSKAIMRWVSQARNSKKCPSEDILKYIGDSFIVNYLRNIDSDV